MAPTPTTFDSLLHINYDATLHRLPEHMDPLPQLIKKVDVFSGKSCAVPIQYGRGQSVGGVFASVEAIDGHNTYEDFIVTRSKYYGFCNLDNELFEIAKDKKDTFLEALDSEVKGVTDEFGEDIAFQFYGNGSGVRGQISATSNVATDTITLADTNDIHYFKEGMLLQAQTTATPATSAKSGYVTIESIDTEAGTITVTGASWAAGIATVAASDYLFRAYSVGGSWNLYGLEAWLPATAPTLGDSFFSVDRSAAVNKLSGIRLTSTGETNEDALVNAVYKASVRGAKSVSKIIINSMRWAELVIELGSRVQRRDAVTDKKAGLGYTAVILATNNGDVEVIPSDFCPYSTAFGLDPSVWTLKGRPRWQKTHGTGTIWTPRSGYDQQRAQIAAYHQLYCEAPGRNFRLDFS